MFDPVEVAVGLSFGLAFADEVFDHTVLQAVVAHDDQAAAWLEYVGGTVEHFLKHREFLVDFHAKALEYLGEVFVPLTSWGEGFDQFSELGGRGQRSRGS